MCHEIDISCHSTRVLLYFFNYLYLQFIVDLLILLEIEFFFMRHEKYFYLNRFNYSRCLYQFTLVEWKTYSLFLLFFSTNNICMFVCVCVYLHWSFTVIDKKKLCKHKWNVLLTAKGNKSNVMKAITYLQEKRIKDGVGLMQDKQF